MGWGPLELETRSGFPNEWNRTGEACRKSLGRVGLGIAHGMTGDARTWLAATSFVVMEYTLVNRTFDYWYTAAAAIRSLFSQGISSFAQKIPSIWIWTSLQSVLRHDRDAWTFYR